MKKTIVLGASPNAERFAYKTVKSLVRHGYDVVPIGIKHGEISGVKIQLNKPELESIHTITVYLNAENQKQYYDYILNISPVRIIFNPGSENTELEELARKNNIQVLRDCTSVMISNGSY